MVMTLLGMVIIAIAIIEIYAYITGTTITTISNETLLIITIAFLHELDMMFYLYDIEDLIRKIIKEKEKKVVSDGD